MSETDGACDNFRLSLEEIPQGAVLCSADGKIVAANLKAQQILKSDASHCVGAYFSGCFSSSSCAQPTPSVNAPNVMIASTSLRLDGEPLRLCLLVTKEEGVSARESINPPTALAHAEERFAKVFRFSPDGITISTLADARYLDANDAFLRMLGWSRDDVVGKTATDIDLWVHPKQRVELLDALKVFGFVKAQQVDFRTRDDEIRKIELSADVIHVDEQPCLLAIARDMTELIRHREHLKGSQKMEAVARLAAGVAHDINNALMVITSYASLAQDHLSDPRVLSEHLEQIIGAAERAAEIVAELKSYSRQSSTTPEILDLGDFISNLAPGWQRFLQGHHVTLITDIPAQLLRCRISGSQFERAILNLLTNARDAMPNGGQVHINVIEKSIRRPISFGDYEVPRGEYAEVLVKDEGIGIAPEDLPKIFEPFYTTKASGKGTGLGLASVYGIVKQANGYIDVTSKMNQGSTFRILLPTVQA